MIEEQALVLSVRHENSTHNAQNSLKSTPNSNTSMAKVRVQRQSACDSCQLKSGCGQSTMTKLSAKQCIDLEVRNTLGAGVDDRVLIAIPEEGLINASLIVYFLPLVLMVSFSIVTKIFISRQDLIIALCGLVGLFLGFLVARRYGKVHATDPKFLPEMKRIISSNPATHI